MSTITSLFDQAQLAEAAYANFYSNSGILLTNINFVKDALIAEKFSPTQADKFLTHWKMVDQSPPLGLFGNGFSATLFESLDNPGQYTLSIAGSVSPIDFLGADVNVAVSGVAYQQLLSLVNYVLQLKAGSPSQNLPGDIQQIKYVSGMTSPFLSSTRVNGVGPGIAPSQLTITGHSLGGALAQMYQRIFGSAGVNTFNSLGVKNTPAIFDQITTLLGLPPRSFSSGSGENLLVPGEPAQLIGTVQGNSQIQVFSETENTVTAHMMGYLTDSLAVYDLFAQLDTSLAAATPSNLNTITNILNESKGSASQLNFQNHATSPTH